VCNQNQRILYGKNDISNFKKLWLFEGKSNNFKLFNGYISFPMKKIIQNKKEKINKTKQNISFCLEKARQKKHYFLLRKDWAKEKRLFRSASPIQFRINIISCYACMIKKAFFGENKIF